MELPALDRYDYAMFASAVGVLAVAYLLTSHSVVRYGAWLSVFTVWMVWFTYYATKYYYEVEA